MPSRVVSLIVTLSALFVATIGRCYAASEFKLHVKTASESVAISELLKAPTKFGSVVALGYDFSYRRPVATPAKVYVVRDATSVYFTFVVPQTVAPTTTQETNGSGVLNDDFVGVFLYPQGTTGFQYAFYSNVRGARYQWSSENGSYSPQWSAVGRTTSDGYAITMAIPLSALRADASPTWKAQFIVSNVTSGSVLVWAHHSNQTNSTDPAFAGTLFGMADTSTTTKHASARFQPYVLGDAGPHWIGGSTSRVGLDFSVPVTQTASIVGTLHPDYSNVEADQQTIAPSAFQRQYYEVRPFFTQATASFNAHSNCLDCPFTLYTPAIPEFREGYAIEGTQGPITFGSFDASGNARTDLGTSLGYSSSTQTRLINAFFQNVSVNLQGIHDETNTVSAGYTNQRSHLFAYANAGRDYGTFVTDPSLSNYFEGGGGYFDATKIAMLSYLQIGKDFRPFDGYVPQNDIAGYESYVSRTWPFSPTNRLKDVMFANYYAVFRDHLGRPAQSNESGTLTFDFKNFISLHLIEGALKTRSAQDEYLPFHGNGASITYRQGTSTQSQIQFLGGAYYHGGLNSWSYSTALPLARKVHVGLELDESNYLPAAGVAEPSAKQWLERASLDWQLNRYASFDFGVRRIVGRTIPNAYENPDLPINNPPYGGDIVGYVAPNLYSFPFQYVRVSNISMAFHVLLKRNEFYAVYGDPNGLNTTPAFALKWIRYIGADKGT